MKVKDIIHYAPKSSIKAREAISNGKYMFFTSSSDNSKRLNTYLLDCEGIIMGTGGNATLHYYNGKFSTSTDCLVLLTNNSVECKYLYYFFLANMHLLEAGFKGAGLKHTNKGYIENIDIPNIPILNEQKRIIKLFDVIGSLINTRKQQLQQFDDMYHFRR